MSDYLGHPVRYLAHADHRTETVRGEETLKGSTHHPEAVEFAGQVTRSHPDGTHDLVIFPPNKNPEHVDHAHEGDGPGQFRLHAHGRRAEKPAAA